LLTGLQRGKAASWFPRKPSCCKLLLKRRKTKSSNFKLEITMLEDRLEKAKNGKAKVKA
jgi:hypothetical protein